jgi:hypothetical protein
MISLTTLKLACAFDSFDELATMLMNLPPSLININLSYCWVIPEEEHGDTKRNVSTSSSPSPSTSLS